MPPSPSATRVHSSAFGCITIPFVLVAAVALGWGARENWTRGELLRHGTIVRGRVTELRFVAGNPAVVEQSRRSGNARGESPVVAFTTRDGEARTAIGSTNRAPAPWSIGDTVAIVYDPRDATRADLVSEVEGWRLWFGVWCAVALIPLAVALFPVLFYLRDRRKPRPI